MAEEIVRKLVNGEWMTIYENASGGSQPDPNLADQGALLTIEAAAETTWAAIFFALPGILQSGWQANHFYSADVSWGVATDVPVFLQPADVSDVFIAEVTADWETGSSEPDWATAPDPGDTVSDGPITWVNCGPLGDFTSPASEWQASAEQAPAAALYLGGQGYVLYPPGGTSGAAKPTFPTDGNYVADGDISWFNVGEVAKTAEAVEAWLPPAAPDLVAPITIAAEAPNVIPLSLTTPSGVAVGVEVHNLAESGFGSIWLAQLEDGSGKFGGGGVGAIDFDVETQIGSATISGLIVRNLGSAKVGLLSGIASDLIEVPDEDIANGQFCIWLDATHSATKVMFKAKDASGSVVTGEIALA